MYDYDQTIELLQRAVAEKGDGHTAACRYQRFEDYEPTGEPVCIVGHVFSCLGLLDKALEGDGVYAQREVIRNSFTPIALDVLAKAQGVQDEGHTWGEALIAAKGIEP